MMEQTIHLSAWRENTAAVADRNAIPTATGADQGREGPGTQEQRRDTPVGAVASAL